VFLDYEDLDVSIEAPGFTKYLVCEKRSGWPASYDDNAPAIPQALRLKRGMPCRRIELTEKLYRTAGSH
jgi:hypothetical protein